jgi:hypothetical protein
VAFLNINEGFLSMRSFSGQQSDRVAIKRSREQKESQLRQLKEQFAALKPHTTPTLRESMAKRMAELEAELGGNP